MSCYSLHSALGYAVRPDCLSQQCFIVTERAERRELCTNISNSWILFNACQFWRCVVSTRLIINSCHLAVIKISFDKSWYSVRSMIMPFWLSYGYGAHFALYGHWNSDMELRWGAPTSGRLPLSLLTGPVRLVTSVPTWSTSPSRLQPRPPIGPQCPGWGQFVIGWDSGDTVTRDSIGDMWPASLTSLTLLSMARRNIELVQCLHKLLVPLWANWIIQYPAFLLR